MARRSEKRDAARSAYRRRMKRDGGVVLKDLAAELGVKYDTLLKWKKEDRWDVARKPGAQPGNQNRKGTKNPNAGAPAGNKNAEKDGAYSRIFFEKLTEAERALVDSTPTEGVEALRHELRVLRWREKKIIDAIAKYEAMEEGTLLLNGLTDMRAPKKGEDGAVQTMGMYQKESPFARVLKLQEALYKVQGRIATVAGALRQAEESEKRLELERQRLELARMRATGQMEAPDEDGEERYDIVYGEGDCGVP